MREIKFRTWDKVMKRMDNRGYIGLKGHISILVDGHPSKLRNEEDFILMQYTGLKDKNEVEIYEGDVIIEIFKYKFENNANIPEDCQGRTYRTDEFEGIVIWDNKSCCFGIQTKICEKDEIEACLVDNADEIEVIGNIYENPELLGGVK